MKASRALALHSLIGAVALAITACGPSQNDATGPATSQRAADSAPSRSGYVNVGGARLYYELHGTLDGRKMPLVVLHGSLMSGSAMSPIVSEFAASRPVITIDARGHGRTGDTPGPITYEGMADDVAGVLRSLGVRTADVLGYSMGGTTALILAARHPQVVGKKIIVSAPAWRAGWYPDVEASFKQWKPEMFAGSPIEKAYKSLSSTADAFPQVIDKLRALEMTDYDLSPAEVRAIKGKTMIIAGDADGLDPMHALELFKLLGGPDPKASTQGYLSDPPAVRLAILPATSHVGMMNQGKLIAELAIPFLDDVRPAPPSGFFEGMDKPAKQASESAKQ